VGSVREGSILCASSTPIRCVVLLRHMWKVEGSIYLGNGAKGLTSVAVGETAGIFSDVVLAAKDCGTVRRPTTQCPQLQAMAAGDLVSAFEVGPAESEARGETWKSVNPEPMASSFSVS
jgi:hypothetical protein